MGFSPDISREPVAYKFGAAMLLVVVSTVVAALGFEHIGGYTPCPLCLQQRYAYYAGVPLLFLALVLVSADRASLAGVVFLAVAMAFLVNAGLGVYQAGAEWGYWPGPDTCGTNQPVATDVADMLDALATERIVRCDEASFRMFGLSLAGWNAIVSAIVFFFSLKAAFSSFGGWR